jgi:hypothetical protein
MKMPWFGRADREGKDGRGRRWEEIKKMQEIGARDTISTEKKLRMVAYTCHSSYSGKPKIGGWWSRQKSKTLSPKWQEVWLKQ